MKPEAKSAIRVFECHGFDGVKVSEANEDEVIGNCPWCGKRAHLYLNWVKKAWNCKRCGESGAVNQWLELAVKRAMRAFKKSRERQMFMWGDRRIPPRILVKWHVGWDGSRFLVPCYGIDGKVCDVRRWAGPGTKSMATPGCPASLIGAEQLADKKRLRERVFLCEGEWDAMALDWLLDRTNTKGVCVAVPGATVFKNEWARYFLGREVWLMYDADEAGAAGQRLAIDKLGGIAGKLCCVDWPSDAPSGFDVRDWIIKGSHLKHQPRACLRGLEKLCRVVDPKAEKRIQKGELAARQRAEHSSNLKDVRATSAETKPVDRAELLKVYGKWLKLPEGDDIALAVVYGSIFANLALVGDPVWVFLVAVPGGMKSELIMSLARSEWIVLRDSVTPHALISGMNAGAGDPSLIPALDGRILAIKDFTPTLTMPAPIRDEIFGQLRAVYDGRIEKQFGNGIFRSYESHFGIIAGVTPTIDFFASLAGLGERFLKFRMGENAKHKGERDVILRAMENINRETQMSAEIREVAQRFIAGKMDAIGKAGPSCAPHASPETCRRLMSASMIVCRMRGIVNRDRYAYGVMVNKPSFEIGTRLGKQLLKLAMGVAWYYGDVTVTPRAEAVAREVARGTAPDTVEEVMHTLWRLGGGERQVSTVEVALEAACSQSTCFRALENLTALRVVQRTGSAQRWQWRMTDETVTLAKESGIWEQR